MSRQLHNLRLHRTISSAMLNVAFADIFLLSNGILRFFKARKLIQMHDLLLTLFGRGGEGIMAPLPWICLLLSHGQGLVNQTSWLCPYSYFPGPRKPFLTFVFQKIEKIRRQKFLGVLQRWAKIRKNWKRIFFTNKPYFSNLNLNCTCSQVLFEVHYTIETQNFKILNFSTVISIDIC